MIEDGYIQKLMEDSAKNIVSSIVEFVLPYVPYLIGLIAATVFVFFIKSSGEYFISYFGKLFDRTNKEIKATKKRYRNFIDLISACKDVFGFKK